MAQVQFVFFAVEASTTATSRRVVWWQEEDELWAPVPNEVGASGATFPSTDPVPLDFRRVTSIPATETTATGEQSPDWRINPSLAPSPTALTNLPGDLRDLAMRRAIVIGAVEAQRAVAVASSQTFDARVTTAVRQAYEVHIAALDVLIATTLPASSNPEAVPIPALPPLNSPAGVPTQGEVLERPSPSGNWLENSNFVEADRNNRPLGYQRVLGSTSGGAGTNTVVARRMPREGWAGRNYHTLMMYQHDLNSDGYADCRGFDINQNGIEDLALMKVAPGKRYEFSAQLSLHRCTGSLYLLWIRQATNNGVPVFHPAGHPQAGEPVLDAFITNAESPEPNRGIHLPDYQGVSGSSSNPDLWPRYVTFGIAPADAIYATFIIRKRGTLSAPDSYIFVHKPMLTEAHERQTQPSQYTKAAPNVVGGELLKTASVPRRVAVPDLATDRFLFSNGTTFRGSTEETFLLNSDGLLQIDQAEGDTWLVNGQMEARWTTATRPNFSLRTRTRNSSLVWSDWSTQASLSDLATGADFLRYSLFFIYVAAAHSVQFQWRMGGTGGVDAVAVRPRIRLQRLVL